MPASELQKKILYFAAYAGVCILILILFPTIEEAAKAYIAFKLGLILSAEGVLVLPEGESGRMAQTAVTIIETVLKILKVIVWMVLVIGTVRFIIYLITKTVYRGPDQGEISSLLKTVLSVIIYIVAFFIIFQSYFPTVELTALFTGSTIVGIVVGLALQDTLGNLFAGIALQADQPFQVGDVIMFPGRGEGVVEQVSWRGVKIRTFQNKLLVISNSVLGKELFEVSPKDNLNARLVFFNTLYVHSPARTIQLVREAVRQVENVSPKMRPVVRVRGLAADGIDWEVKYWLEDYRRYNDTDALIRQRIWYTFQREKIDFAFPTRTVHIEEKKPEAAPEEVINTFAERLNKVSIFSPLSDEEVEQLANASTSRVYAPEEAIVRKGQAGGSMFVIARGSVKVQLPEQGYQKTIGTLKENDFFGEMSLLTGEPRSANVVAAEETEVIRIDKAGLKPILEGNPVLVESIYELVEERKRLLETLVTTESETESDTDGRKGVMRSIKKFFGLRK